MDFNKVVLVGKDDLVLGEMGKLEAHQKGLLHRAFSIFVFNSQKEFLLQRRALGKYHSGGLWSNTCCSHPAPNEAAEDAAHRRLEQEMGFVCNLVHLFHFTYKCDFPKEGLYEHELDHVFAGTYEGAPTPDPQEAMDWRWIGFDALNQEVRSAPDTFSFWFKLCYQQAFKTYFPNS